MVLEAERALREVQRVALGTCEAALNNQSSSVFFRALRIMGPNTIRAMTIKTTTSPMATGPAPAR